MLNPTHCRRLFVIVLVALLVSTSSLASVERIVPSLYHLVKVADALVVGRVSHSNNNGVVCWSVVEVVKGEVAPATVCSPMQYDLCGHGWLDGFVEEKCKAGDLRVVFLRHQPRPWLVFGPSLAVGDESQSEMLDVIRMYTCVSQSGLPEEVALKSLVAIAQCRPSTMFIEQDVARALSELGEKPKPDRK